MKQLKTIGGRVWGLFFPDNRNEVSYLDVKELYDAAYEEKAKARACLYTYKSLMQRAEMLEQVYRAQLASHKPAHQYGKAA